MTQNSAARIVLVEDNPGDEFVLRQALGAQGCPYILEVLSDGAQALQFVRDHDRGFRIFEDPCVFILDLHLPKYDGTTVLRAIRQSPTLSKLRVIIFSGLLSPREEAEVVGLDVQLVITKPDNLDGFMKVGAQIFEICRGHSLRAIA